MIAAGIVLALLLQGTDTVTVVRGARVLDVRADRIEEHVTLTVRGGRIVERRTGAAPMPAGANVIDAAGLTVMAGLIDAHVHLTLAGRPRDNAAATLKAGFTTVADLGSAGGGGVRLQRLVDADSVAGPRIIPAGSWIGGRGGVCEFGGATIRGADEARARAQSDIAAGARMLKLCITDWLDPSAQHPDSVQLTDAEIDAVAAVARSANVSLVAHAIGRRGAAVAARAGVKLLAHTPVVTGEQARELARGNVCVATTMTTLQQGTAAPALRASFQLLRSAGVRLIAGTDAGVLPHGRNADELVTLQQLGMSSIDVLRAATSVAADCLGFLPGYGDLAVGAPADLIAVRGDPRADLALLRAPVWVMKGGRR